MTPRALIERPYSVGAIRGSKSSQAAKNHGVIEFLQNISAQQFVAYGSFGLNHTRSPDQTETLRHWNRQKTLPFPSSRKWYDPASNKNNPTQQAKEAVNVTCTSSEFQACRTSH